MLYHAFDKVYIVPCQRKKLSKLVDEEDATEYVAEKACAAVVNLSRIEEGLGAALEDIRTERKRVTDSI